MHNNQNDNNTNMIILPSGVVSQSPLQVNYIQWFVDHYKEVFAAAAASIPVFGAIISFAIYVKNDAFNTYFNINENWTLSTVKDIYKLLYRGIFALTVIFPNVISLWILIFNKKAVQRVKKELKLTLVSMLLIGIVTLVTKKMNLITNGLTKHYIFISVLIVAMIFLLPLIYTILCDVISLVEVCFNYRLTAFRYFKNKFKFRKLKHPFENFAKMVDKANQKNIEKSIKSLDDNISVNQSKGIALLILLFFLICIFGVKMAKDLGRNEALNLKSFSVIELADSTEFDYDDLKESDTKGNLYSKIPYVKYELDDALYMMSNDNKSVKDFMLNQPKNKRIINSYTVLAEGDDSFLIANSFLDKSMNNPELYIFTDEQTIIDKKDVRIKKMNFVNVPELR